MNKDPSDNLNSRGRESITIGYCGGSRGYRLWDLGERKVVRSRDFLFDETTDPFQSNENLDVEPNVDITDDPKDSDADTPVMQVD